MTLYEYLLLTYDVQKVNRANCVSPRDIANLPAYARFLSLYAQKLKVSYIISVLSSERGLTERSIYRLLYRMGRQISLDCLLPKAEAESGTEFLPGPASGSKEKKKKRNKKR